MCVISIRRPVRTGMLIPTMNLRLVQPNENAIPTGGLHTIEHTIAVLLRERIPGYIDCSPFGCRTGFHLLTWGEHSTQDVAKALKEALEFIAYEATWDDVPATTIESCGNYRDHSLFTAKEWAKDILAKGISSIRSNARWSDRWLCAVPLVCGSSVVSPGRAARCCMPVCGEMRGWPCAPSVLALTLGIAYYASVR